ncbi:ribonuclease Z [Desulfonema ishimotonii]|uniref:Ribonuclease Z n=1 Tax=Desulfonema ishimotonii TaxID=45657 RepID=A0A401FXH1_9BACT|nr:ribonuclease Z [Desulfonema ishimotonii]GBC61702.1 ribonuclease Z [Desulfonema ishimotonii]
MCASFHPRLINLPFDDPGVFVPFRFEKRAILFDLGTADALSSRDMLKISHVFISHTHMDHFVGFDRLLRLCLGREKELCLYGPPGFLKNIGGKLTAYSWNLVQNYPNWFALRATEVHPDHVLSQEYLCQHRFMPRNAPTRHPFDGILLREPALTVSCALLDHHIPCLGFRLAESFHVNIIREKLDALNLSVGPWLKTFKDALTAGKDPAAPFEVPDGQRFTLGDLADQIAMITPGQKMAYITDAVYSPSNAEKIIRLARGVSHLFIEAAFLEAEAELAEKKYHLTARQAGELAGKAGARQFTIFHFSPRYTDMETQLYDEAQKAYNTAIQGH